ncbi:KTSC domain-containing protein [Raoultella planticola]|uniref:KTSC domain-containing protein n=1 Tax=Raoultella planticola TaxID=575 RepID=A0A5P6A9R7_RAOPL|nr:KTSC domain-containing protein [Raoultella planticola]
MDHHPVKSSRIASIAYDEASGILEIRFHDDSTLRYEKVPERIYRLFFAGGVQGTFYDGVIKGNLPNSGVTHAKM